MKRKTQKKQKYSHSLIFLHGFTANSCEMEFYRTKINDIVPDNVNMKYIFLNAPRRKVSYFRLKEKYKKPFCKSLYQAWYDYLSDNAQSKIEIEDIINTKHVDQQRKRIHKFIEKEIKYHKGDSKKVFIGGYSQGACMALDSGITFSKKIGGIIGIKGHILGHTDTAKKYKQDIFVSNSKGDQTIYFSVAKKSYLKYKKYNFNIKIIVHNEGELRGRPAGHNMEDGQKKEFSELGKWLQTKLKINKNINN